MQIKDSTGRIVAHIESMECKHPHDDLWVFTARTGSKAAAKRFGDELAASAHKG